MKAQDIFSEKGYSITDNRNIEWKAINTILNMGVEIAISDIGFEHTNKNGYSWKLAVKLGTSVAYYKAKSMDVFVGGKWCSNSAKEISRCVLDCLISFRRLIIEEGNTEFIESSLTDFCKVCNGTGINKEYRHIHDGICYTCYGFGKVVKSK